MYEVEKAGMGYSYDDEARQREVANGLVLVSSQRDETPAFDGVSDLMIDMVRPDGALETRALELETELATYLAVPYDDLSMEDVATVALLEAEQTVVLCEIDMINHAMNLEDITDDTPVLSRFDFISALELSFALKLDSYKEAGADVDDLMFDEALLLAETITDNVDGKLTVKRLTTLVEDLEHSIEAIRNQNEVVERVEELIAA